MTAFWRICMMIGKKDHIIPWHLYKNPVAYLDDTAFSYNYAKYGINPSSLNFYKITAQAVKSVLPQAKFGSHGTEDTRYMFSVISDLNNSSLFDLLF